jgi:hypothetical protein
MILPNTADGLFHDGQPFNGLDGTLVSADWLNGITQELVTVLGAAGMAPNGANNQVLAALRVLMAVATTQARGDASVKVATDAFVQSAIAGIAVIALAGADVVLTQDQWGSGILIFTGVLTANVNVIVPAQGDRWTVFNRTTGAFVLSVKTQQGAGVVVRGGVAYELICDSNDVFSISGGGSGGKAVRFFLSTS